MLDMFATVQRGKPYLDTFRKARFAFQHLIHRLQDELFGLLSGSAGKLGKLCLLLGAQVYFHAVSLRGLRRPCQTGFPRSKTRCSRRWMRMNADKAFVY